MRQLAFGEHRSGEYGDFGRGSESDALAAGAENLPPLEEPEMFAAGQGEGGVDHAEADAKQLSELEHLTVCEPNGAVIL
nr:MAG: hypothetical protein EDM05_00830 [Leptolyngbya sp. IPPAS B-1204]